MLFFTQKHRCINSNERGLQSVSSTWQKDWNLVKIMRDIGGQSFWHETPNHLDFLNQGNPAQHYRVKIYHYCTIFIMNNICFSSVQCNTYIDFSFISKVEHWIKCYLQRQGASSFTSGWFDIWVSLFSDLISVKSPDLLTACAWNLSVWSAELKMLVPDMQKASECLLKSQPIYPVCCAHVNEVWVNTPHLYFDPDSLVHRVWSSVNFSLINVYGQESLFVVMETRAAIQVHCFVPLKF